MYSSVSYYAILMIMMMMVTLVVLVMVAIIIIIIIIKQLIQAASPEFNYWPITASTIDQVPFVCSPNETFTKSVY